MSFTRIRLTMQTAMVKESVYGAEEGWKIREKKRKAQKNYISFIPIYLARTQFHDVFIYPSVIRNISFGKLFFINPPKI